MKRLLLAMAFAMAMLTLATTANAQSEVWCWRPTQNRLCGCGLQPNLGACFCTPGNQHEGSCITSGACPNDCSGGVAAVHLPEMRRKDPKTYYAMRRRLRESTGPMTIYASCEKVLTPWREMAKLEGKQLDVRLPNHDHDVAKRVEAIDRTLQQGQ